MLNEHEIRVDELHPGVVVGEVGSKHPKLNYLHPETLTILADGLDNFLNFVKTEMPKAKMGGSSSRTGRGDFNAFDTYKEAMETFLTRPESVIEFDPSEMRIKDESESGSVVNYDVVGDYIDMGRYMEGIPEAWGSMRMGNARNRRVNIMVNTSQAHYVNHKDILRRGERVLRLVDALEAGGVRTELTVMESAKTNHVEVLLKRHDEPLTISDLAVASHPEFLRRIIFRVIEHSKTFDFGYGSSIELSKAVDANPSVLQSDLNDEMNIYIGNNLEGSEIDDKFDKLEKLLIWEMSKPVPEVDGIKLTDRDISFNPNGARASADIKREGLEVINNE